VANEPEIDPYLLLEDDGAVYRQLLSDPDASESERIAGMLAFTNYSVQKLDYIAQYQRDEDEPPSIRLIHESIRTLKDENSEALKNLKEQSRLLLSNYVSEQRQTAQREEIVAPIEKAVRERTSFRSSVLASVVGRLVSSLLVAIIIFISTAAIPNSNFARAFKVLFSEETTTERAVDP